MLGILQMTNKLAAIILWFAGITLTVPAQASAQTYKYNLDGFTFEDGWIEFTINPDLSYYASNWDIHAQRGEYTPSTGYVSRAESLQNGNLVLEFKDSHVQFGGLWLNWTYLIFQQSAISSGRPRIQVIEAGEYEKFCNFGCTYPELWRDYGGALASPVPEPVPFKLLICGMAVVALIKRASGRRTEV